MSNPEVEVRSFKQQGGESFKDAWYRTFMLVSLAGIDMFLIVSQKVTS